MSISGDATVHTLVGDVLVVDLAARREPTLVFTWDGSRITVGQALATRCSRGITTDLLLDDGAILHMRPESYVLSKLRTYRRVSDLAVGESLLPLYLKEGSSGPTYHEFGDWFRGGLAPSDRNRWRRISRMVAEWKLGRRLEKGEIVEHVDGCNFNCAPENLRVIYRKSKPPRKKAKFAEPIFEANRLLHKYSNHKVAKIETGVSREMFSIRGVGSSNLAVCGVFVCTDES